MFSPLPFNHLIYASMLCGRTKYLLVNFIYRTKSLYIYVHLNKKRCWWGWHDFGLFSVSVSSRCSWRWFYAPCIKFSCLIDCALEAWACSAVGIAPACRTCSSVAGGMIRGDVSSCRLLWINIIKFSSQPRKNRLESLSFSLTLSVELTK